MLNDTPIVGRFALAIRHVNWILRRILRMRMKLHRCVNRTELQVLCVYILYSLWEKECMWEREKVCEREKERKRDDGGRGVWVVMRCIGKWSHWFFAEGRIVGIEGGFQPSLLLSLARSLWVSLSLSLSLSRWIMEVWTEISAYSLIWHTSCV